MQSCKNINPRSKTSENQLVRFIKSWPVVVALVSASFTFGWYFGATKFDKEKIEFYELTKKQAIEINELKGLADSKDSIISALENHNTKLQIDLTSAEEGRLLFYSESEKYKELLKKSSNNN